MRHRRLAGCIAFTVLAASVGGLGCASAAANGARSADSPQDAELGRIRTAVETKLPKGVRLVSITRADTGSIVMDFSRELLAAGPGPELEDALHQILTAAASVQTSSANGVKDYRVLIDGVALESYLR
jgi:hypothetical protein